MLVFAVDHYICKNNKTHSLLIFALTTLHLHFVLTDLDDQYKGDQVTSHSTKGTRSPATVQRGPGHQPQYKEDQVTSHSTKGTRPPAVGLAGHISLLLICANICLGVGGRGGGGNNTMHPLCLER